MNILDITSADIRLWQVLSWQSMSRQTTPQKLEQTFFTEVLDFDEEGIELYGHAVMEFIMRGFLLDSCPKEVFIEETWKKADRETYIECRRFVGNADKITGIFNVWHCGKVIKVLFIFERNPYFMFPKLISLDQIMVVADCSEKTDDKK